VNLEDVTGFKSDVPPALAADVDAAFHREQLRKNQIARCVPHHTSRPQGLPEDFPGHGCDEDADVLNELDGGDKKTDVEEVGS